MMVATLLHAYNKIPDECNRSACRYGLTKSAGVRCTHCGAPINEQWYGGKECSTDPLKEMVREIASKLQSINRYP